MLLIQISFLTGRYHATPWGRNVNEGVPEWPPSPYRLVRGIYDVWKRKRSGWPVSRVEPLLSALASNPPLFSLPQASTSHTRAFLSENSRDITGRQLIFDAFVLMKKGASALLGWPNINLNTTQNADLKELLSLFNYLGRSESWVSMRVLDETGDVNWNCTPADIQNSAEGKSVNVACVVSSEEYSMRPYALRRSSRNKGNKTIDWMDAIAWSTSEMLNIRQSNPPALFYQTYTLPAHCFEIKPFTQKALSRPNINGVLYAMESKILPSVTSTIEISDRFRRKLMGIHKNMAGDPRKLSEKFSGKNAHGNPSEGHKHIYILPQDLDRDGLLDHLLVVCKEFLTLDEQLALDRLDSIWQSNGKPDIQLIPVQWGKIGDLKGTEPSAYFISATPFLPPRHYRRDRKSVV